MIDRQKEGGGVARGRRSDSFSLVEMLVALAILSILTVVLLSMATSLMGAWQMGQAKNERRTIGQTVLERMSRDIRQAALPGSRSNINSLEFIINPSTVSAKYEYPQSVFWQAPVPTDGGTNGNLAAVGYFVQWINSTPSLSRVLINPSDPNYLVYSTPASWITDSILTNNAPATPPGYAGLLAENVLSLWVQALDPQGVPIQQSTGKPAGETFDSRLGYSYTNSVYPTMASTNLASVLPAAVQIAIVVVDSRTAGHLTGTGSELANTSMLSGNFWADVNNYYANLPPVIKKGAEIQTTTVNLASGPR